MKDEIIKAIFEKLIGCEARVCVGGVYVQGSLEGDVIIGDFNGAHYIPLLQTLQWNAQKPINGIMSVVTNQLKKNKLGHPIDFYSKGSESTELDGDYDIFNEITIQLGAIYLTNVTDYNVKFNDDKSETVRSLELIYKNGSTCQIRITKYPSNT